MTYDPITYWRERGETYRSKFRAERYAEQEAALEELLRPLEFQSVLEVGCGFGRIGAILHRLRPAIAYTGIDLSPAMLETAREELPGAELLETSLEAFKPKNQWDLVIAVEVLMHVPPEGVVKAVRKLDRLAAAHIVTLDWTTPLPRKRTAEHNFLHDYPVLLGKGPFGRAREVEIVPVGVQAIHHVAKA